MKESKFQRELIKDLEEIFPGCIVIKNDPGYIQGFPDLTIFFKNFWAVLETKRSTCSSRQPNQEYYISLLNSMSYAAFIYPENKEEILNELQQAFKPRRTSRISRSK